MMRTLAAALLWALPAFAQSTNGPFPQPIASAEGVGPPRELACFEQPFANHNGGHVAFRPGAAPGDADFGLLYLGVGDGGSGGDPLDLSDSLGSAFGKILRLDPFGTNGRSATYGVPADSPFAADADDATLAETRAERRGRCCSSCSKQKRSRGARRPRERTCASAPAPTAAS